jgi:quinol monooxygenase YgiN
LTGVTVSVWEFAEFNATPGMEDDFERAILSPANISIWQSAEGCLGVRLHRAVDVPGRFMLMIEWETVAHHREIFAASEGCRELVASIEPYYPERPRVCHTGPNLGGF